MATAKNGINGPFSGKIGSVVGYMWKGRPVMRAMPKKTKKKPSVQQLANRQRMAVTQRFLKHIVRILRKGFAEIADEKDITPYMAATSYNKLHAISGEYPDIVFNPALAKISLGNLPGVENAQMTKTEDGLLFNWEDNQHTKGADKNDRILIVAYDPAEPHFHYMIGGAYRKQKEEFLSMNDMPTGTYEIYVAFITLEGDKTSDSIHLGTVIWEEEN